MAKQKKFKISISNDDLLGVVKDYTDTAKSYYTTHLKSDFAKYHEAYKGNLDDTTQLPEGEYNSLDIAVTINTIMPDIQKLVFTDEPVTISPRGAEDVEKAQKMQALLNYQVTQQNNYSEIMEKVSIDSLIYGTAFLKCHWQREYETKEFIEQLTLSEVQALEDAGYKVNSEFIYQNETGEAVYLAKYEAQVISSDKPIYERLPYWEIFIDPSAKRIDEADYIIHRRLVTLDYLKREEEKGNFKNVKELIDNEEKKGVYYVDNFDEDDLEKYLKINTNKNNKPLNTVMLYEFWGKIDINEDGYLENVIVTFCGDYILSVQENNYKMYPFFAFTPFYETNKIYGKGIAEYGYYPQLVKTVLTRELLFNTRANNDRKLFYKVDDLKEPEQLASDEKYVAVRETADINNIFAPEPFDPISPNTQNVLAYFDRELQKVTGISDIKQGVKSSSNETATEATIKFEAANSQIQSIALHFGNTMKDLYKFIMYQNQQFLTQTTVIRLFNDFIEINPEDIQDVSYDLQVSSNLGGGTKETRLRSLQSALQMTLQVLLPNGLSSVIHLRNIAKKILEETGLKDTDNYLISEQELNGKMQQMDMQNQIMQMQAMAQAPQGIDFQAQPQTQINPSELPANMKY